MRQILRIWCWLSMLTICNCDQGGKFIVAFDGYTDKEEVRLDRELYYLPSCIS